VKAEEAIPKAVRSPAQLPSRFVRLIGKLFAAEARSAAWPPERRQPLRCRYSARVLDRIEQLLIEHRDTVVPASILGKALQYLYGQWPKLVRYVDKGAWPISNNECENAIRPFVVSRKGWLFSDTVAGAKASANLYSLVETCKANAIDPYRYLTWLFKRLPLATTADDYDALLPWNMPAELRWITAVCRRPDRASLNDRLRIEGGASSLRGAAFAPWIRTYWSDPPAGRNKPESWSRLFEQRLR
jgi:hypothetical protein